MHRSIYTGITIIIHRTDLAELVGLLVDRGLSHACAVGSGDTGTPLNVLSLVGVAQVTSRQHVELIFLLVHAAVGEPEKDTGSEGDDGDTAVVPDEMGIGGQGGESLGKRSGEGSGEALDRLNERTHVLGRLGEGVLESGDGGENLRDSDEHVDTSDGPDGNGRLVVWVAGLVVSRGFVSVQVSF
jgi:hypothetical protein